MSSNKGLNLRSPIFDTMLTYQLILKIRWICNYSTSHTQCHIQILQQVSNKR